MLNRTSYGPAGQTRRTTSTSIYGISMRTSVLLSLALLLVAWPPPAQGQWVPVAEKKGFGQALTADESTVFVGDPDNTYTPGRVFVYEKTGDSWSHRRYLEAEDGALDDRFGSALDANDGMLAVGAPAAASVYLFQKQDEWTQVAQIEPADTAAVFGDEVALTGDHLFVTGVVSRRSSTGQDVSRRVVFVFKKTEGVSWRQTAVLRNQDLSPDSQFGAALLARGNSLMIGAPQYQNGVVAIYRRTNNRWLRHQVVTADTLAENAQFGTALQWAEDHFVVGAPQADGDTGTVFKVTTDGERWTVDGRIGPFDDPSNAAFGASLAYNDDHLWVGAPGTDRETGALYRFRHTERSWSDARRIASPDPDPGDAFGATLAVAGSNVAVGLPGDRYGGGTLGLYAPADEAWTADSPLSAPTDDAFSAITGEERPCTDGQVAHFSCKNVDLKAFLPVSAVGGKGGVELSDVWGWTDPQTGTEYALVGRADGTAFVDVSTPTNPIYVGELLRTDGSRVNSWRDIKVYKDHAFIVADNVGDHGMQIFDLTQLRDVAPSEAPVRFESTAHYDRINSAHNIAINKETGYAYIVGGSDGGQTCGGGLHMVNIQDPLNPTFEGCFGGERGAGSGGTGATHDTQCVVYEGPDQEYRGREICVAYNETEIAVVDVTEKSSPQLISTASYPNYGYVHQGWFTDDQRYLYSNDEGDEIAGKVDRTRTIVWDMNDLDNPTVANQLFLSTESSDHNLYVKGDRMYQSNYKSGLRVLDISTPTQPEEIGHFDLFPPSDTPGFEGTWSNYPYFESGVIVTATYDGGFFVLKYSNREL